MINTCSNCGKAPSIATKDKTLLSRSSNNLESVNIICPNCNKTWTELVKTDHGITNQMSGDFNDKV